MILAAHNLTIQRGATTALTNVTATFHPGQVSVLLGPNGAGKSTLLTALAGLIPPTSGTLTIPPAAQRPQSIGYLPQTADIHWDIDVQTLVHLGRFPHRHTTTPPQDAQAIAEALKATDTSHLAARPITTLSGGERSRVLLARVLAGQPQWLLADEPLASLDPRHQLDSLNLFRQIASTGTGVILVLHDLNQAARVADHLHLLKAGQTIAAGPPTEVLTPETLRHTYDIEAHITTSPTGHPQITLL